MATRITLEQITKRYGALLALKRVALEVPAGEMVAVVGPSGCGKSTLLRLLAGFIAPDEGQVLFDGQPVQQVPPERRPTSLVFQNYALWPHKTVFQNIAFGLQVRGWKSAAIAERVREMLALVGLSGLEARYPGQLSGGQQQRVALARSLAVAPAILLLDEPLSNLDAQIRLQMRAELRSLQRRVGITTLYVTHDQEEALSVADRVIVMREGVVEQYAAPPEIYQRPASAFVARFVGQSNLLRGCLLAANTQELRVKLVPHERQPDSHPAPVLVVPRANWIATGEPRVDAPVMLAVKPEQFQLASAHTRTNEHGALLGEIQTRSFLGARWHTEVATAWGILTTTTSDAPEQQVPIGATVLLQVPCERVMVFEDREPRPEN